MAKKHRKGLRLTPDKIAKRKVKTEVRLVKAEDMIWIVLNDFQRKMDVVGTWINEIGFKVELRPMCGSVENVIVADGWNYVASKLGMDKCEYCLNADGESYVLIYNVIEVEA